MPRTVNRLRNPNLKLIGSAPRGWTVRSQGKGVLLRPAPGGGALLTLKPGGRRAWLEQTVRCKPGEFYRVEAVVCCYELGTSNGGGAFLGIRPALRRRSAGDQLQTPPQGSTDGPVTIRAYFQAPPGVREAVVSVGLTEACDAAEIRQVRFIHVLEPEQESHPLALPPPIHVAPPPVEVRRVCVCAERAEDRTLTKLLKLALGDSSVDGCELANLRPRTLRADAILLPDSTSPTVITSLQALESLAADRIVVISLSAFQKLAGPTLRFRRIEQPDDPMHAKVTFSNFATLGFALVDVFPFAEAGKNSGGFAQNQLRKTPELTAFCKKNGYITLLTSVCHTDAATGHPIGLLKPTPGGAVVALDLTPLEATPSTFAEPAPGWHLLLSILGRNAPGLGQFTVPVRTLTALRELIREMGARNSGFVVNDEDVPAEKIQTQLVTIGGEDQSYGLPLKPRPVILVRSGLLGGDVESVYAAMHWFKSLVRPPPHACPYADALTSRFRLAWVPCSADWEVRDGWQRSAAPPEIPTDLELDDAPIAALVDFMSVPSNTCRAFFARQSAMFSRAESLLRPMQATLGPAASLAHTVPTDGAFTDAFTRAWRREQADTDVLLAPAEFRETIHTQVLKAGGDVVRIEIPGDDRDFVNHSIARTGRAATLLEQIVGLCYGVIAVNRTNRPRVLDGFPPVAPGQAVIIDANERALRASSAASA